MYHLLAHIDRSALVITLDRLTERADLECELWDFVRRPAGPHNARRRERMLLAWRRAKRLARAEDERAQLLAELTEQANPQP